MIRLEAGDFGWDYRIIGNGRDIDVDEYIQTDWDYPRVARTFGWNIEAAHKRNCTGKNTTDGTVKCDYCGVPETDFIRKAGDYLDRNIGKQVRSY